MNGWTSKPDYNISPVLTYNLKKEGSNLIDAGNHLYFQCNSCETIFDPATKSFKTLHDKAREGGWKITWNSNGLGYKIDCKECVG